MISRNILGSGSSAGVSILFLHALDSRSNKNFFATCVVIAFLCECVFAVLLAREMKKNSLSPFDKFFSASVKKLPKVTMIFSSMRVNIDHLFSSYFTRFHRRACF